MKQKPGRKPSGDTPARNRTIRLTDKQWQTFLEKLGTDWLRERIAEAENDPQ